MEAIREAKAIWEPRQYNPWSVKPSQGQVEVLKCLWRGTRRSNQKKYKGGPITRADICSKCLVRSRKMIKWSTPTTRRDTVQVHNKMTWSGEGLWLDHFPGLPNFDFAQIYAIKKLARILGPNLCHHPADSIIPVSYTLNQNYILTTLKSFHNKKYSLF